MSIAPENVARVTPPKGSDHALATNRDYTTGVGLLTDEDLSVTTSGRLGVWMGHTLIVGAPADHGTVADEAAMLALHDWSDDPHTRVLYHYVQPGDSVLRADDPGWRWFCVANHGRLPAEWERRPLADPVLELHEDVDALESDIANLAVDLSERQPIASALTAISGLDVTDAGLAALEIIPDATAKLVRLNPDGTWTLIDIPGSVSEIAEEDIGWPEDEFTYSSGGDTNGIFYAIGGGASWVNPHTAGYITITTSGGVGGGSLADLVDRAADDIYISGGIGTYVQIDIGANRALLPTMFTIRNNSNNYDPLRNWEWRGSNDLANWVTLDVRVSDSTLSTASVWGAWVPSEEFEGAYRYFRLVRTGATGGGGGSYIRIGEIELYGTMTAGQSLPAWADCWLTDGGGHVWPGITVG